MTNMFARFAAALILVLAFVGSAYGRGQGSALTIIGHNEGTSCQSFSSSLIMGLTTLYGGGGACGSVPGSEQIYDLPLQIQTAATAASPKVVTISGILATTTASVRCQGVVVGADGRLLAFTPFVQLDQTGVYDTTSFTLTNVPINAYAFADCRVTHGGHVLGISYTP